MLMTIDCTTRPATNPRALRRSGKVPATIYGHNGGESTAVTLDTKQVIELLRKAVINNTLIEVNVTDGDFKGKTLLREVQHHPYKNEVYHLSFFAIQNQSRVEVSIPLHFTGVPVGVKVGGGSVDVGMNEIRVSCPPEQVPEFLEVDITELNVGQGIHIGDLKLPEGVKPATDTTPLVVTILKK
ncbi:MAG: 50S ribosomal protein L25/general stress protein Ctc [Oscillatoriales cyanobacterium SM2_2_1]|nr:50S ribosomal protein L25/general stress protein Ctc [Oscillatoriales cyanobacterium SM2_2_1]